MGGQERGCRDGGAISKAAMLKAALLARPRAERHVAVTRSGDQTRCWSDREGARKSNGRWTKPWTWTAVDENNEGDSIYIKSGKEGAR